MSSVSIFNRKVETCKQRIIFNVFCKRAKKTPLGMVRLSIKEMMLDILTMVLPASTFSLSHLRRNLSGIFAYLKSATMCDLIMQI